MSHLPRNNQYEIFTHNTRTHCFDDLDFPPHGINTPVDMVDWIRSQDTNYWSPMTNYPDSSVAFYLKPELYLAWKLKFL